MSTLTKNRPAVPAEWHHVDALTEPGPDASPAARHHWHCQKLLRSLDRVRALPAVPTQATCVRDLARVAREHFTIWTDADRHASAARSTPSIGPAHNAVLALYYATVRGTPVPSEPNLLAMAEACVAEFSGHWDRLGPTDEDTHRMQAILKLIGPQGCTESKLAGGLFKQNWGGSRNRAGNYRLTPGARKLVNAMIPRSLRRTGAGGHSRYVLGCAPAGIPAEIRADLWPRQE